eukprot:m.277048 g.277048  ORF g.277048 m.277048 type:complete len:325 (-) comp26929_c0_seq13:4760-5734(-)
MAAAAVPRQTPLTCSGHTRPVVDLAFSPITADGFFLISACKDGKPILRNGMTGDWIGTFEGHKGAVWGATIDRQAKWCATGAADFSAKTWNAETGDELNTYQHPHIVKTVDFSADATRLLTGCNDKGIRCWDVASTDAAVVTMTGHTGSIKKALFDTTEQLCISGGDDKTMRVWDIRTGSEVKRVTLSAAVTSMELSQNGSKLTTTHGSTVTFWDPKTMEKLKEKKTEAPTFTASLHPDSRTYVWGGLDNMLHVCNYETGEQLEEYKGHFGPVHCVRYSPDGEVYASGSEDGTVRLWQTRVGTEYGLWRFNKPGDAAAADTNSK